MLPMHLQVLKKVKDNVQDLNEAVALSSQGGFGAIADIGSKIASGFSVAQSAMALFGSESKELEETLMKVQAAMALAQGAKELGELGKSFDNLKTVAGGALKSIKAEVAATGIGLLVIALGTIVAYWDDIKGAVSGVSAEQKKLLETTTEIEKNASAQLDKIERTEETLKLQGKTEKEIFEAKVKAANVDLEAGLNKLKVQKQIAESEIAAAERNEQIAKVAIQVLLAPITMILTNIDLVGKAFGKNFGLREGMAKSVAGMLGFSSEETRKEAKKTIDEQQKAIDDLTNKRDGWINAQNEKNKQEAQKAADLQAELNKILAELRNDNLDDERKKAKDKENLDYQNLKKEYETKFKGRKDLDKLLEELRLKHLNSLSEIDNKFNIEEENKKKENEKKRIELSIEIINNERKAIENQRKLTYEEQIAFENRVYEATISNTRLTLKEKEKLQLEHDAKIKQLNDGFQAEIKAKQEKFNADQLSILDTQIKTAQRLKQNTDQLELDAAKLKLDTVLNDEKKSYAERLAAQEEYDAKVAEIDERERQRKERNVQFGIDSTVQGLQTLQSLVTAFAGKSEAQQKRAFEINKAAQIAETIISTISGAQKAYTSQLLPGDPTGPIRGAIAAALTIAGGIARVRQIEQTKFESKSSSSMSSGGGGGGGEFAPNLNAPVGNTSTNLSSIGFGGQESEPVKVFVTETDISSTQNKVQKIEQKASIE
jgi:DNA repair exonuclease SbcCD ATPase subunit